MVSAASNAVLFTAVRNGDVAGVLELLRGGAPVDARDDGGATPLHWVTGVASVAMATALLDAGAPPDALDKEGKAPIYWLAKEEALVALLLARGADAARHATLGGATPLHRAAEAEAAESVRRMLAAGVPVDVPTSTASYFPGRTPLHGAAGNNALEAARALLDAGADVNAQDDGREGMDREGGDTPLHLAAEEDDTAMIALLLDRGADRYIENNQGRQALED